MTTKERRTVRKLRLALPAILAVAVLAAGPIAGAQTPGAIQGKVVNGTSGDPLADAEVTLQLFSVEADLGALTASTDAKGRFSFADLPDGVAGYQLETTYQDAAFRSATTGFTAGQTVEQTLTVWEPTTDPADVILTDYIVWVDREGDGVAVQHDFNWSNGADTAYVGGADPSAPEGAVVTVPLPQGATNLQYLGTFLENPGDVVGQTYVSQAPIVPGTSTATVRYNAPPLSQLTLTTPFATTSLQLFVPQDVKVTAKALRLAGTVTDTGVTYQVYAADNVAAGTTIDVAMSQGEGATSSSSKTAMWILLAVGGLVLLGALVTMLVRRAGGPRSHSSAARTAARPMRAKARAVEPKANGQRDREPARAEGNGRTPEPDAEDPELIIEEIAALDLSFDRGLLDERTYKRLRVAAKDRLLRAEGARTKGGRAR